MQKFQTLCIVLFSCIAFAAFSLLPPNTNQLVVSLDQYCQRAVQTLQFSGAVLVAKNGQILLDKGYGKADYELDVPASPKNVFRIASITKQFTAACIMQLQERGLLSLQDPIGKYIPNFPYDKKDIITIYDLLTHSSGLNNRKSVRFFAEKNTEEIAKDRFINSYQNIPLLFKPGTKFQYSNQNYVLLGFIVEKVTGLPFKTYLKTYILDRLQMNSTKIYTAKDIIPNRVPGYVQNQQKVLQNALPLQPETPYAQGGLLSTTHDLYIWNTALKNNPFLSQQSIRKMFIPRIYGNNTNSGYGLGFAVNFLTIKDSTGKTRNIRRIWHGGKTTGFRSVIARYIDDDACIIILSNNESFLAGHFEQKLAAILFAAS